MVAAVVLAIVLLSHAWPSIAGVWNILPGWRHPRIVLLIRGGRVTALLPVALIAVGLGRHIRGWRLTSILLLVPSGWIRTSMHAAWILSHNGLALHLLPILHSWMMLLIILTVGILLVLTMILIRIV